MSSTLGVVAQSHEPGTRDTSVKQVMTKLINNPNESLRINHPQQKSVLHSFGSTAFSHFPSAQPTLSHVTFKNHTPT